MPSHAPHALPSAPSLGRNPGKLDRDERKMQVLSKFTAQDNFPVLSSIINSEMELSESDRARMKLSRLAIRTEGESHLHASQIELIGIIESMDAELKEQWKVGDRVKALRIAIQAIKLLGNTKVPQCYPSLFILAATVLDTFGDLVADRILDTACKFSPLVAQLVAKSKEPDPSIVPEPAVEMCNNWFLKILSIRELLPRVYVELSLMRTYRYVAKKFRIESMRAVVERLAMQVRGVADPLVAAYARWYVCLRAADVLKSEQNWGEAMILCCEDNLQLIAQLPPYAFESKCMSRASYVALFKPSFQWLFDTVATYSSESAAEQLFDRALRMIELNPNVRYASILHVLVCAFSERIVFQRVDRILLLVTDNTRSLTYDGTPRIDIITALCHVIADTPPPLSLSKAERLTLINSLWELIECDEANFEGFMSASRALLRLLAVHATHSQCSVLVSAVTTRCRAADAEPSGVGVDLAPTRQTLSPSKGTHVYHFIATLIRALPSEVVLSIWASVLPLMNLLNAADRDTIARSLLSETPTTTRFSTTVTELCRQVHDGLTDDAPKDLRLASSEAVCRAIRRCFTTDVQLQLRFMCECRHSMTMLDDVKITLVHEGIRLAQSVAALAASASTASAKKSKRSAAKACFAFCHATSPGIADGAARLRACMTSAAVAFHLGFVAQAEALLQLSVTGLNEVLSVSAAGQGFAIKSYCEVASIATQLLNLGAAAPPHSKYGHLYCLTAVLHWASGFPWPDGFTQAWSLASATLSLLGALLSCSLPLVFAKCPNPALYVTEPAFQQAATRVMCQAVAILQKYEGTGRLALSVVESSTKLFSLSANPSCPVGPILQRSLRSLVAHESFDENDPRFVTRKRVALKFCETTLGPMYATLLGGPDLCSPELDEFVSDNPPTDEGAAAAAILEDGTELVSLAE